jgi:hypothetical protein
MAAEALSLSVNLMATGLILFQLSATWSMASKAYTSDKERPKMYSNVAGILIESAAPLAVVGVCYITVTAINFHHQPERLYQRGVVNCVGDVSGSLLDALTVSLRVRSSSSLPDMIRCQGLSPQMIIYRVFNGQSWRTRQESEEAMGVPSKPIEFSTAQSGSTSDTEDETWSNGQAIIREDI